MTAFGRPGDRELDLAGFGRTVGLLALALRGFGLAHGNARTVDAEIQGRFYAVRLRLDGLAFVGCDRAPQRFGGPLDLLGVDGEPGQFVQQGAGLFEADSGGAAAAVMRVAAGDNVVSSMPRVRSRGQNPVRQDSQW